MAASPWQMVWSAPMPMEQVGCACMALPIRTESKKATLLEKDMAWMLKVMCGPVKFRAVRGGLNDPLCGVVHVAVNTRLISWWKCSSTRVN